MTQLLLHRIKSKQGKLIVVLVILFITDLKVSAQMKFEIPDTSEFRFELDIKYVGASTKINANYQYVLEHLIEVLNQNPDLYLHIRGHVCCGPAPGLSQKRAKKVYKYLLEMGIPEERMTYHGYSDEAPLIFPEETEEDGMKNRRVDFILSKEKIIPVETEKSLIERIFSK